MTNVKSAAPGTWVRTCDCGAAVTTTGNTGPCDICEACAARLLAVVMGQPGKGTK